MSTFLIYGGMVFILAIVPIIALYITRNNPFWQTTIIKSIRFFLGFVLFGAGLVRFTTAFGLIGPPWLITELSKYGLGFYAEFISFSEILIGYLLMTNRFGTLGAVMSIPMFANILAVVISLNWPGTPFVVFSLFVLNIIILLYDWHKLKFILTDDVEPLKEIAIVRSDIKLDALYGVVFLLFILAITVANFNKKIGDFISIFGYISVFALWLYTQIMKRKK
jgi:hypothetical protein